MDPTYELSNAGIALIKTAGRPGQTVQSAPSDCFKFNVGDSVRSAGTKSLSVPSVRLLVNALNIGLSKVMDSDFGLRRHELRTAQ